MTGTYVNVPYAHIRSPTRDRTNFYTEYIIIKYFRYKCPLFFLRQPSILEHIFLAELVIFTHRNSVLWLVLCGAFSKLHVHIIIASLTCTGHVRNRSSSVLSPNLGRGYHIYHVYSHDSDTWCVTMFNPVGLVSHCNIPVPSAAVQTHCQMEYIIQVTQCMQTQVLIWVPD